MEDKTKATETPMEENKTIGRRELLKALAAGGGAVAASAVVSGKWVKPVIEAGVLPAHAQTSALIYYKEFFTPSLPVGQDVAREDVESLGEGGKGPSAMKVIVEGTTAYVEANNGDGYYRIEAELDTGGTPTNGANIKLTAVCGEIDTLFNTNLWSVEGYTLGDSNITIKNTKGETTGWIVVVPSGDGTLPDLLEEWCESD